MRWFTQDWHRKACQRGCSAPSIQAQDAGRHIHPVWQEKPLALVAGEGAARWWSQAALEMFPVCFWRCELPSALHTLLGKNFLQAIDAWMARRLRHEQQTGFTSHLTLRMKYSFHSLEELCRAPLCFPLPHTVDGWINITPLHQDVWHGRSCRPGIPISSWGQDEKQLGAATKQNSCPGCVLSALLQLNPFPQGEGECAQSLFN